MTTVKISRISDRVGPAIPKLATAGAGAYDAFASEIEIKPDGLIIYKLGFKTEFPSTLRGKVAARSGLTKEGFVVPNGEGVIDSDYRGEWQFRIRPINPGTNIVGNGPGTLGRYSLQHLPYQVGERCCQVYFEEVINIEWEESDSLSETERGDGGFHSTNK